MFFRYIYEKTWVPLLSAYPRVQALALPFPKDKQHELAHAVRYDGPSHCGNHHSGRVSYTQRGRSVAFSSGNWSNLRDLNTEDNVRKRPLPIKSTFMPLGQSESVCNGSENHHCILQRKIKNLEFANF